MIKNYLTWGFVLSRLKEIDKPENIVYGIPSGGMIACAFLKQATVTHDPRFANLIIDDIVDSGATKEKYTTLYPEIEFWAIFNKQELPNNVKSDWVSFPWEQDHPKGKLTVDQNIVRSLQYLGEDVTREGLLDTPKRVIKSWGEIYKGYNQKPEDILTTFAADGYDQIVLLKDIELYSMCEHHMLPFFGKAHVAYIPGKKVIGISKLARLVDIYARRLQIQERIGDQVTSALMEHLQPLGAACIIEATHMCMRMRGVAKQNSIMTTSSIKGVFMDNPAAKSELMELLR